MAPWRFPAARKSLFEKSSTRSSRITLLSCRLFLVEPRPEFYSLKPTVKWVIDRCGRPQGIYRRRWVFPDLVDAVERGDMQGEFHLVISFCLLFHLHCFLFFAMVPMTQSAPRNRWYDPGKILFTLLLIICMYIMHKKDETNRCTNSQITFSNYIFDRRIDSSKCMNSMFHHSYKVAPISISAIK